jgi:hypothetical protein
MCTDLLLTVIFSAYKGRKFLTNSINGALGSKYYRQPLLPVVAESEREQPLLLLLLLLLLRSRRVYDVRPRRGTAYGTTRTTSRQRRRLAVRTNSQTTETVIK